MRWLLAGLIGLGLFIEASAQEGNPASDSTDLLQLNRVIIIGNKKTLDQIILRELTLKSGDTVRRAKLDGILLRDKNKIYNLRIFNSVRPRVLELPDKTFDVLIELEERWYTFPIPVFELSDRNFNEWWQNYNHKLNRVNYGLRLYQYNFRGRNETIRLTAQFGFSTRFEVNYRIPYITKKQKAGLIFDFNFYEPKNLAYRTLDHKLVFLSSRQILRSKVAMGVSYLYRKSFYETHGLTLEYDNTTIADTIRNLNPQYFLHGKRNQWYTALSYNFVSEHRDVVAYPLKGYQFLAGIKQIGLGIGEPVNQTILTASLAYHREMGKKFFFSNFTSGYLATPKNPPYALFFGQGYRRQFVRGYEIYVIEGPAYWLNKTTIKRRIFQHTYRMEAMPWEQFKLMPVALYLKAYADFGYTRNYNYYEGLNQNTQLSNRLLGGVGLGFDLVTSYDSVFRVEYTYNREGAHGFFFHIKKEF